MPKSADKQKPKGTEQSVRKQSHLMYGNASMGYSCDTPAGKVVNVNKWCWLTSYPNEKASPHKSQDDSKYRWEEQMFKLFRRKYIYDLSIGKNFLSNPSSAPKKPLKTKKANEMFILTLKSSIQQKTLKTK